MCPDISQFRYSPNSRLPKLAWLAQVDTLAGTATVWHGSAVEVRDTFFIEGVWAGDFTTGDFSTTDRIFGTGATFFKEALYFVSSASTTDRLYYRDTPHALAVSNSLPILLAFLDDRLDPAFVGYADINESMRYGINDYVAEIPTKRGTIRRLIFRNLRIGNGGITEIEKDLPPHFTGYKDYISYVDQSLEQLVANLRDRARTHRMHLYSTQSRGYDTTAVNSLAARHGIDKVFTVTKGKSNRHFATHRKDAHDGADDDGTEICRVLGLNCVPIDRRSCVHRFVHEHLYHACLHASQDGNLQDLQRHIRCPAVLLTGVFGEMWLTQKSCITPAKERLLNTLGHPDLAGYGLSEVRLVIGFIQLALPYVGARSKADIYRITESEEMARWRLGTTYDRPIPRRIAEEAGVPRSYFGQRKVGSVVTFPRPYWPCGRKLREEFLEFIIREGVLRSWETKLWPLVHYVNTVLSFYGPKRYKAVYYLERLIARLRRKTFKFRQVWSHLDATLYCFCVNKCAADYSSSLDHPFQRAPHIRPPAFENSTSARGS